MNDNLLEDFGKEFIKNVRDVSIEQYEMIQTGNLNSESAQNLFKILSSFDQEQKEKIDYVVKNIIDRVLHKTLYMFEVSSLVAIVDKEEAENNGIEGIGDISDGLAGELYSEDGWIANYSEYPYNE